MKVQVTRSEITELINRAPLNYPLNFVYGSGILMAEPESWEANELNKIRIKCPKCKGDVVQNIEHDETPSDFTCMDCGHTFCFEPWEPDRMSSLQYDYACGYKD